jgi:hypothetical protein
MNGTQDPNQTPETQQAPGPAPGQGHQGHAAYQQPPVPPLQPAAPPLPSQHPSAKSPALACVLSAMPGLGQVYVGYYQRGFVHALVVASLIAILNAGGVRGLEPLFGMFLAFFWLYNIIDAGRRANLYNQVLVGSEGIELPSDFKSPSFGGSIVGGLTLIAAGIVLLLHTQWEVSLDWLEDWWPVAPILLGVYLVARAVQERAETGPGEKSAPPRI